MVTVFDYKQKYLLKIFLLLLFGFFSIIMDGETFFRSVPYWSIFLLLQAMIYGYDRSKKILLTDQGIEKRVLYFVALRDVNWEKIIEASMLTSNYYSKQSSAQLMVESFGGIKWFAERSIANTVKIIIDCDEALYIDLKEIKNSSKLYELIKEKIRFVR